MRVISFKMLTDEIITIEIDDSCEISLFEIKEKIISKHPNTKYWIEGGFLKPEDLSIVIAGKNLANDNLTLKQQLAILNKDLKDLEAIHLMFKKTVVPVSEIGAIKYSAGYLVLEKNILEKYIQPFINEINNARLSVKYIIQESMRRFQNEVARDIGGLRTPGSYLDDISNAIMPNEFKKLLMTHAGLRETYKELGKVYINNIYCAEKSDINPIYIQTIIRELFTDILAPFPEFKPKSIDTSIITASLNRHNESSELLNLPNELQSHINSFLQADISTVMNYRSACKNTYAKQKINQDNIKNIYYTVTKPICITQPRGWRDGSVDICLKDRITDKELIEATKISKNSPIKIFKSLHDAQEYAQFMQQGGKIFDADNEGVMPAVMMVSAIANFEFIKFRDEVLKLNPGTSSSGYSYNERNSLVSYASVPANAVLPLAAISLYQVNIGQFRIFNKNLHLNPEKISSIKSNLKLNVEGALSTLSIKAQDLLNRNYIKESKVLLEYASNLRNNFNKLEADLLSHNLAPAELIDDFKKSCSNDFDKIMTCLDNHRGYNHIIVEALLSIVTAGVYFAAMCFNKIKNDKYTFFSTDTGNKLKDTNVKLNNYLTLLSQPFVENVTTNENSEGVAAKLGYHAL